MKKFFVIRFWLCGYCYIGRGSELVKNPDGKIVRYKKLEGYPYKAKVYKSERACLKAINKLINSSYYNVPKHACEYSIEEYTDISGSLSRRVRGSNTLSEFD